MQKIRAIALLMIIAMVGVTGFQAWWLKNNYDSEKQNLDIRAAAAFRGTVLKLQASKLEISDFQLTLDSGTHTTMVVTSDLKNGIKMRTSTRTALPPISMIHLLKEKLRDSLANDSGAITIIRRSGDSVFQYRRTDDQLHDTGKNIRITYSTEEDLTTDKEILPEDKILIDHKPANPILAKKGLVRFLNNIDSVSIKDSITLKELDAAFHLSLKEENINVGAMVSRLDSGEKQRPNEVNIGFARPIRYDYFLSDTSGYIFSRLKLPLIFSLLLVGITIASFILLYRNLMKQKRLAELKNEFISNITHELKTPIATVGVAIEALKNFSVLNDPKRTSEYLDISQQELQRLNLLVDKVLKLSMFENKVMEMNVEWFDLEEVVREVVRSMRLQLEKYQAIVDIKVSGDAHIRGDRLHLVSVVYNLLDNALKYGKAAPQIQIELVEQADKLLLRFADNGIGIPAAYQDKVFEKFFRVPHGDTHTAKGYGLGLSYVSQVIKNHGGKISMHSEDGKGTEFFIELPKTSS